MVRHRVAPLIALAVVVLAGSLSASAGAGPAGKRAGTVRVATSGSYSERIERLPITRSRGSARRVAMSLSPHGLPRLLRGDRLQLSSEIQFTLNCPERIPRCNGPPYRYDPEVAVRLVLARSPHSVRGRAVSATKRITCQQRRPREHHCVAVIADAGLRIPGGPLPCPLEHCFVNLVVDAHSSNARRGDVLIVGGNKPDGSIPQDRGRINAIVFHPARADYPKPRRTRGRVEAHLPLDLKRHVVYSQRLRHLEAGEQLAVDAEAVTERAGLPYSVRTSSQLILAEGRRDVRPGPLARRLGGGGEIGEANGFNCTRDRETCTTRKVGVLRLTRSPRKHGRPRPMFVNLVMIVGPKRFKAGPGDRYDVLRRGGLSVTHYRPPPG
jgi:hypothetical protein